MTLNISLELTLPDNAAAVDVVYLLRSARMLASTLWPGAKLRALPLVIPCTKSASPHTTKVTTTG